MATTFVKIATVTVGAGGASTIDFTSIPSTYTDLCLKLSIRSAYSGGGAASNLMRFNNSATGYGDRYISGNGSAASSAGNTGGTVYIYVGAIENNSWTSNTFGNLEIYIPNYASSNNKSVSWDNATENNATTALAQFGAGLWSNSAAINQITFYPEAGTGNYLQYSTATLYGISKS